MSDAMTTIDPTIAVGDFVELTEDALRQNFRKRNPGEVVGEAHGGTCWKVRWGGNNTTSTIHKSFVQVVRRGRNGR